MKVHNSAWMNVNSDCGTDGTDNFTLLLGQSHQCDDEVDTVIVNTKGKGYFYPKQGCDMTEIQTTRTAFSINVNVNCKQNSSVAERYVEENAE